MNDQLNSSLSDLVFDQVDQTLNNIFADPRAAAQDSLEGSCFVDFEASAKCFDFDTHNGARSWNNGQDHSHTADDVWNELGGPDAEVEEYAKTYLTTPVKKTKLKTVDVSAFQGFTSLMTDNSSDCEDSEMEDFSERKRVSKHGHKRSNRKHDGKATDRNKEQQHRHQRDGMDNVVDETLDDEALGTINNESERALRSSRRKKSLKVEKQHESPSKAVRRLAKDVDEHNKNDDGNSPRKKSNGKSPRPALNSKSYSKHLSQSKRGLKRIETLEPCSPTKTPSCSSSSSAEEIVEFAVVETPKRKPTRSMDSFTWKGERFLVPLEDKATKIQLLTEILEATYSERKSDVERTNDNERKRLHSTNKRHGKKLNDNDSRSSLSSTRDRKEDKSSGNVSPSKEYLVDEDVSAPTSLERMNQMKELELSPSKKSKDQKRHIEQKQKRSHNSGDGRSPKEDRQSRRRSSLCASSLASTSLEFSSEHSKENLLSPRKKETRENSRASLSGEKTEERRASRGNHVKKEEPPTPSRRSRRRVSVSSGSITANRIEDERTSKENQAKKEEPQTPSRRSRRRASVGTASITANLIEDDSAEDATPKQPERKSSPTRERGRRQRRQTMGSRTYKSTEVSRSRSRSRSVSKGRGRSDREITYDCSNLLGVAANSSIISYDGDDLLFQFD